MGQDFLDIQYSSNMLHRFCRTKKIPPPFCYDINIIKHFTQLISLASVQNKDPWYLYKMVTH